MFSLLLKHIGFAQLITIITAFLPCNTFFNFVGLSIGAESLKRAYFAKYQKRINKNDQNTYLISAGLLSALISATISTTLFVISFAKAPSDNWFKFNFYHDIFLKAHSEIFLFNFICAFLMAYIGGFLTFRLGYGQSPIIDDNFLFKNLTEKEINEILEN